MFYCIKINKNYFWLLLIFFNLKLFSILSNKNSKNINNSKNSKSSTQPAKSDPAQVTKVSNDIFNEIYKDPINKNKINQIKNKTAVTKVAKEEKNNELSQFESSTVTPVIDQECKKNNINLNSQTCNDIKKQVNTDLNKYVFSEDMNSLLHRSLNTTETVVFKDIIPVAGAGLVGHQIYGAVKKDPKNPNSENSLNKEKETLNAEKQSEMSAETSASQDAIKAESSLNVADGAVALEEGATEGAEIAGDVGEVAEDLLI